MLLVSLYGMTCASKLSAAANIYNVKVYYYNYISIAEKKIFIFIFVVVHQSKIVTFFVICLHFKKKFFIAAATDNSVCDYLNIFVLPPGFKAGMGILTFTM